MSATQRPRSHAGLYLLLYFLFSGAASRVAAETDSPAGKFGAFALPLTFLALGVHAAFKHGGRTAKVCSTILVGVLLAAFAVGMYRGYQKLHLPAEVDSEVRQLHAGLSLDLSSDAPISELARRQAERTDGVAQRLQASDDRRTAEFGRAFELLNELANEADPRLLAAVEALEPEHLLSVADMLDGRQFDWRREAIAEYAAASQAGLQHADSLPERAQALFIRERITREMADGMLAGVRDTQPFLLELWRRHEDVAGAYLEFVDLIERNLDTIRVEEDGTYGFEDPSAMNEFEQSRERAMVAGERLEKAAAKLLEVLQG